MVLFLRRAARRSLGSFMQPTFLRRRLAAGPGMGLDGSGMKTVLTPPVA